MGRIVINAFVTLDGVMRAPGRPAQYPSGGFSHGGRQHGFDDEDLIPESDATTECRSMWSRTASRGSPGRTRTSSAPNFGSAIREIRQAHDGEIRVWGRIASAVFGALATALYTAVATFTHRPELRAELGTTRGQAMLDTWADAAATPDADAL